MNLKYALPLQAIWARCCAFQDDLFICVLELSPASEIQTMKQTAIGLKRRVKKTRKRDFLEQMEQVVPWGALVKSIAPYLPKYRSGRPPFSRKTVLRMHFMLQLFWHSSTIRGAASLSRIDGFAGRPEESTRLHFRHQLEKRRPSQQILVTVNELLTHHGLPFKTGTGRPPKNKGQVRDPDMHSSKKGNQWYFA